MCSLCFLIFACADEGFDEEEYDSEGRPVKKRKRFAAGGIKSAQLGLKRRHVPKKSGPRIGAAVVSDDDEQDDAPVEVEQPDDTAAADVELEESKPAVDAAKLMAKTDSMWASLRDDMPAPSKPVVVSKPASTPAAPTPSASVSVSATSAASPSAAPAPATTGKPRIDFSKRTKSVAEIEAEKVVTVVKTVEFAGEKVSLAQTLDKDSTEAKKHAARSSGLDKVLAQWDQLKQMTTFDKSKVDWEQDKQVQGDEHELAQARKNGFLDKMHFLNRVDQKQFEIEREERLRRSVPSNTR
jgi:hypothetical protein